MGKGLRRGLGAVVLAVAMVGGAVLATAATTTERLGGADRYLTSVAISQRAFSDEVGTVFLASGEDYPDAVVAGAAAGAYGYPVLLTKRDEIPDAVSAELDRLDPATIVILGGPAAISDDVKDAVSLRWGAVTRLGGANRYSTAVLVSEWAFNPRLRVAYIASGEGFPDALAGGVAGALKDGPILLTDPKDLSPETAAHLADLRPRSIVVLGGAKAVSDDVVGELEVYAPVSRLAGADRYVTSAVISAATFTKASTVLLASGTDFPDALSGTPLAADLRAPVLLVESDSVSTEVCTEVRRLGATRVIALGGTSAVSDPVLTRVATECTKSVPPLPTPGPTETIGPPPATTGG